VQSFAANPRLRGLWRGSRSISFVSLQNATPTESSDGNMAHQLTTSVRDCTPAKMIDAQLKSLAVNLNEKLLRFPNFASPKLDGHARALRILKLK
jgi:hypothetical protein